MYSNHAVPSKNKPSRPSGAVCSTRLAMSGCRAAVWSALYPPREFPTSTAGSPTTSRTKSAQGLVAARPFQCDAVGGEEETLARVGVEKERASF